MQLKFNKVTFNDTKTETRFSQACNLRQEEAKEEGRVIYCHKGFDYLPEISMVDIIEVYSRRGTVPEVALEPLLHYASVFPFHQLKAHECRKPESFAVYETEFYKETQLGLNVDSDSLAILNSFANVPNEVFSVAMAFNGVGVVSYNVNGSQLAEIASKGLDSVKMFRRTTEFGSKVYRIYSGVISKVIFTDKGVILKVSDYNTFSVPDHASQTMPTGLVTVTNQQGQGTLVIDYNTNTVGFGKSGQFKIANIG